MSIRLMGEMATGSAGKTGDPVQLSDDCIRTEVKQIDIFAKREMSDSGIFFHDQAPRRNPGQSDAARGMNRIAKVFFENAAPCRPRQQDRQEH